MICKKQKQFFVLYDVEIVLETSERATLLWSRCVKHRFPNRRYRTLYGPLKNVFCNDVIFHLDHTLLCM